MDGGDYVFLNRNNEALGIERCEIGNFVQKLGSGELEEQMIKCAEYYSTVILLIEGVYDEVGKLLAVHKKSDRGYIRTRIFPHTRYDTIEAALSSISEMGIEIVHSPNFECSIVLIRAIYMQRTKPEEERTLFRKIRPIRIPAKMSTNPAVPKLMGLCPRLPERTAIKLINQFGSIWNVLHVDDTELLQIEGFGKGLLDKLKKEVGKDG